ncbi:LuxR C-terminal-related transcriptional regulator [Kibdelosporangium philippinense]|uniref:LuxR C-terminal-related transcriptional regulator n=1 Tax=Kibdelosporangium philippinense TaxID=211113 RepID=A0ABS8Z980_9PSEU|nr:LuxR C-terminal-related transcriptional regulator [Kibdelosporangium philippinense]MCE7003206.1 LuxR C-terminal-related transcriptional regulator [Kibdelosporangium philippinense]
MRVLLVDNQSSTRASLAGAGLDAESADIATAAQQVAAFRPQVLLLGDHRALRFISELRDRHPEVRVMVLSQTPPAEVLLTFRDGYHDEGLGRLTAREQDVLRCLAKAYDNDEIADELGIAVRTVNRHLEAIRGKLGTRRRSHLVRLARTAHAC